MNIGRFDGWSSDAISLVERAIEVHGGRERWQEVRSIRLPLVAASGLLLRMKGYRTTFTAPAEFEVRPHEPVPNVEHRRTFRGHSTPAPNRGQARPDPGPGAPIPLVRRFAPA